MKCNDNSDTDKSRGGWFLRGTFYALVALIFVRGIGLARSALVARILQPEVFGSYSLIISFLRTTMVLSAFGLGAERETGMSIPPVNRLEEPR